MLDPKLLRSDIDKVAAELARRGAKFDVENYTALETRRKALQVRTEDLQKERNNSSKSIGQAVHRGEDVAPLKAAVAALGEELKASQAELSQVQEFPLI